MIEIKEKIQKIWNDPVWSKIISSTIICMITFVYGLTEKKNLIDILQTNIQLYWVLIMSFILIFLPLVWKKSHSKLKKPEIIGITSMDNIYGYSWRWNWKFINEKGVYQLTDFRPVCPHCGQSMSTQLYSDYYSCPNGHSVDAVRISWTAAKSAVFHKLSEQYLNQAQLIEL